jgi:hypothetical protein
MYFLLPYAYCESESCDIFARKEAGYDSDSSDTLGTDEHSKKIKFGI